MAASYYIVWMCYNVRKDLTDRSSFGIHIASLSLCSMFKAVTEIHPGTRNGDIDPTTGWQECQGHIVKRACGIGDVLEATVTDKVVFRT